MTYQVLATKLYVPPIQANLVRRPRLVQVLESGYQAGKRVTLVSAPAGFGKTTLIREWITDTSQKKPFGWLSLDDGDNDPVRFLVYLVSAIQKVRPEFGQSIIAILKSSQIPPLMDLVETLINEVSLAGQHFFIILDDYHLIKKVQVHSILQLLLKRQPDALHLIIITREDPPYSLPRMRVQGLLTEIRERDLRFTFDEAQSFLANTMGLVMSAEEISKLEERTEGWAAGMQLAALALEEFTNQTERHAFIDAFAGNNRLIFDYLITEVLQRQDEITRRFLLRTSVLERFCAQLCDQVVFDDQEPASRSWKLWKKRTCSWCPWITSGAGIVSTICSAKCCTTPCSTLRPTKSQACTTKPAIGSKRMDSSRRRSSMPWRGRNGST
jgi:LuxR family maltose regulon positive regulatory protein